MDKTTLRQRYLAMRRALPQAAVAEAGAAVAERLRDLGAIGRAAALLSYVASKDNELDTRGILAWALGQGKTVLVPVCMPKRAMAWSVLRDFGELAPTSFGVLEPRVDARELAFPPGDAPVLVPGIAFDRRGYRIGYGAGYFDRFLAHHAGLKIGLAYECQIIDAVPHEPHDVPMDVIVTERGIDTIDWTG